MRVFCQEEEEEGEEQDEEEEEEDDDVFDVYKLHLILHVYMGHLHSEMYAKEAEERK